MISFLRDLFRDPGSPHAVIVMDEEQMEQPRQHAVTPAHLLWAWGATTLGLTLLALALVVGTPLRELIPGYGTSEIRQEARLTALRLASLQDSLRTQEAYVEQLRRLMLGQAAPEAQGSDVTPEPAVGRELADVAPEPATESWLDHDQPALPMQRAGTQARAPRAGRLLEPIGFPVLPPVQGIVTRGFDARIGHFALDIAAEEGSRVEAIGAGHVVFADWTQDGGYALAVQHPGGYVSVYKHNRRLLKRVGDRVSDREAIALSGNTGEVTTGPHLHFELWHDGLAQDPRAFLLDL